MKRNGSHETEAKRVFFDQMFGGIEQRMDRQTAKFNVFNELR